MTKEKFKQIRVDSGLTQVELADKLGITPVHISRLENGHDISKMISMAMKSLTKKKLKQD